MPAPAGVEGYAMTKKQALRILLKVLTGERRNMKELAGNANAYKMGMPAYEADYKEYQQLAKAMRVVEDEILGQGEMEI